MHTADARHVPTRFEIEPLERRRLLADAGAFFINAVQPLPTPAGAPGGPSTSTFQAPVEAGPAAPRTVDRARYADRLRAMWLGEAIANWTGLQTELARRAPPFYTDDDWEPLGLRFITDQNPFKADDDTDIEYVYAHLLQQHQATTLTGAQIRQGWVSHVNRAIWASNASARALMGRGAAPPVTGTLAANPNGLMIDAQLTTEIFGAFAPGLPAKAMAMADLPIRTTATGHAAHAAQTFALLYSLATDVDQTLPRREQMLWLVAEARKYLPPASKAVDVIDTVVADYLANPDPTNWELTRDRIYERYDLRSQANGFVYRGAIESSVNFATGIMCLLYGEGDFKQTVRIGTLSGWDSDNPTATMGGLLGLMYGTDELRAQFPGVNFSDRFAVYRTRDNLPDHLPNDPGAEDTFTAMAARMLPVIDRAVAEAGGRVDAANGRWVLPAAAPAAVAANPLWRLTTRSANYRVRADGGTVTASSSVAGSGLPAIADAAEHNFDGREVFGPGVMFRAGSAVGSATLDVTYDRPFDLRTVRLIEGGPGTSTGTAGGFASSATVQVRVDGQWVTPAGVTASEPPDPARPFQLVDFVLPAPVRATGVRVTGPVSGPLEIIELDALADEPPPPAAVVGRHLFYNRSAYDGNDPLPNADDDAAVAADKSALLPGGGTPGPANVTSYSRGINGVMIDVANLPPAAAANLGLNDVSVRTTSAANPGAWSAGPAPTSVTLRPGAGAGGSGRVTLVWPDGAITNRWVEVTLLANTDTGLTAADVFCFGNLAGDADGSASVNLADFGALRQDFGRTNLPITDGRSDFDRDGSVNLADFGTLRTTFGKSLHTPPPAGAATAAMTAGAAPAAAPALMPRKSKAATRAVLLGDGA